MKINVVLVDDDAIVRDSVGQFLNFHDSFEILGSFCTAEEYIDYLRKHDDLKHIVILDIGLPGISGLEAIPEIKKIADPEIIMLTTYEEEDKIVSALCKGASSYISKRAGLKAISEAIEIVNKGGSYMSPAIAREIVQHFIKVEKKTTIELPERQLEILEKLTEGSSYQQIAEELHLSVETIRSHIKKMYRTLCVNNKVEAVSLYLNGSIKK